MGIRNTTAGIRITTVSGPSIPVFSNAQSKDWLRRVPLAVCSATAPARRPDRPHIGRHWRKPLRLLPGLMQRSRSGPGQYAQALMCDSAASYDNHVRTLKAMRFHRVIANRGV
jgi:hypothetical protein